MHIKAAPAAAFFVKRNHMRFDRSQLLLYAVTERSQLKGGRTLPQAVEEAIRGGATMVQLREKHLTGDMLLQEALAVRDVCRRHHIPFIVNDDPYLAARVGADGVHVGQEDTAASEARKILGPGAIIGVTAKTAEQAEKAQRDGADYLGCGAVFGSKTKTEARPMSKELLRTIAGSTPLPVVAIGGIGAENGMELAGTGISGLAVVSAIFSQEDVCAAAAALRGIAEQVVDSGRTAVK